MDLEKNIFITYQLMSKIDIPNYIIFSQELTALGENKKNFVEYIILFSQVRYKVRHWFSFNQVLINTRIFQRSIFH